MKKSNIPKGDYIHKEYPKTCAHDDFWGQVKRTVNGVAVSQVQIDMIISAIRKGLSLSKGDVLLDIGCGNGALSHYLFNDCAQLLGIDFSEYLISVAKTNFEKAPFYIFKEIDAVSYLDWELKACRFTKALCYGCLPYLSFREAEHILRRLSEKFSHIKTIYIGNLPDKKRAHLFYEERTGLSRVLDDNTSPIGIWRSKEELTKLSFATGWSVRFHNMPDNFYAAHYRYDAILSRL
jgi:cyclopropane fatty-acyl-phospholipid synthase-like methyltransferase